MTLFSVRSMRAASFTAVQLLDAGCTLHALRGGGYSLQQLRLCGFSALDLVRECSSSTVELRAAGYSAADCIASGITVSDMSCYTTLSGRVVRCGAPSAPQSIHSIICTGRAATRCPSCCSRMSAPHKRCTPASRCRSCGVQGECCVARLPLLSLHSLRHAHVDVQVAVLTHVTCCARAAATCA